MKQRANRRFIIILFQENMRSNTKLTAITNKERNDNEKINEDKQTWLSLLEKYKWLVEKKFLTANIFIKPVWVI